MASSIFTIHEGNLALACAHGNRKRVVAFRHLQHAKKVYFEVDRKTNLRLDPMADDSYTLTVERHRCVQFGKTFIREIPAAEACAMLHSNGVVLVDRLIENDPQRMVFECKLLVGASES
jgi:hypothetical protein